MVIYSYIVFCIIAICALFDVISTPKKIKDIALFIIAIILILFSGFREGMADLQNYKDAFLAIKNPSISYDGDYFEPLFKSISYFISFFTSNTTIYLLTIATISVGLTLSFYRKNSQFYITATLLYFVHAFLYRDCMQIRAGIAAAILLYSLKYIKEKKLGKFGSVILIAGGFHLASLPFCILYFVYHINLEKKIWYYIIAGSLIIGLFFPLGFIVSFLSPDSIFKKAVGYMWMLGKENVFILSNPTIIKQLFFVLVGLLFFDKISRHIPNFRLYLTSLLISVCWLMAFNDFSIIAARIATFFSIVEVLIVPYLLYFVVPRDRIWIQMIIIAYAFTTLYLNVEKGILG